MSKGIGSEKDDVRNNDDDDDDDGDKDSGVVEERFLKHAHYDSIRLYCWGS